MSEIWHQKMNLDISSQDLQDFILMVFEFNEEYEHTALKAQVRQIQQLGVKLV